MGFWIGCSFIRFEYVYFPIFISSDHIVRDLELCAFFDGIIQKDMFFLTVHDAVLHIKSQLIHKDTQDPIFEKVGTKHNLFLNALIFFCVDLFLKHIHFFF